MMKHDRFTDWLAELAQKYIQLREPIPITKQEIIVQVIAPRIYFMRAKSFIEDINDTVMLESKFNLHRLLMILWDGFLGAVRSGKHMNRLLINLYKKHRSLYESSSFIADGNTPQRYVRTENKNLDHLLCYEVILPRKNHRRIQMLLHDIHDQDSSFVMTVNELLSLLFIDFIHELRFGKGEHLTEDVVAFLTSE